MKTYNAQEGLAKELIDLDTHLKQTACLCYRLILALKSEDNYLHYRDLHEIVQRRLFCFIGSNSILSSEKYKRSNN